MKLYRQIAGFKDELAKFTDELAAHGDSDDTETIMKLDSVACRIQGTLNHLAEVSMGTKRHDAKAHRDEITDAESSAIALVVEYLEKVGGDVERYTAGCLVEAAAIEWPPVNDDVADSLDRQHAEITRTIKATLDAIDVGDIKRVVLGSKAIATAGRRVSKTGLLSGLFVSVGHYTRLASGAYVKPAIKELRRVAKDDSHVDELIGGLRQVLQDAAERGVSESA